MIQFKTVTAYNNEGKKQDDAFIVNCSAIVSISGSKDIEGKHFCCLMLSSGTGCWLQMSADEAIAFFNAE